MQTTAARVLSPREGKAGFLGSIGVRFMIDGHDAAERFSLVERFDLRMPGEPIQ